ncbi:MAG: hypothetical protein U1E05_20435 [Patescibacteria group bacterium]|nr:hypothetical protein [Patescibacteria group bacterium]
MPHPLLAALFAHYPTILATYFARGSRFESHEFIQKLARDNQADYIRMLNHYVGKPAPFKLLHRQLSRHLHDYAHQIGRRVSTDIFGDDVSNSYWEHN